MSVDLGTAVGYLDLDTSKFKTGLQSAFSDLQGFTDNTRSISDRLVGLGSTMASVGKGMTTGLTLPLLGVAGAALSVGNNFEAQMSRVKAISGATADEFEKLNEQAVSLGASTSFSASEAAQGMENLASAGFTVTEIMSAMPGMLDLAASSGSDLATASDIAASTLRGFAIETENAGHVADVFAKAAADTNAGVEDMGEAMKYIAPVAHAMGQSLEETAAAVGIMADAGIKGSQAGTTLRGALTRLVKPTKAMRDVMDALGVSFFDSQGKMLPLNGIIEKLETSTKGLTQEQKNQALATLFGQEALSGMLALVDRGSDSLVELTEGFENADGSAKAMAETMLDNTKGSIEQMFGSLESAGIKIQQVIAPAVVDLADGVSALVDKFMELKPETQEFIVKLGGVLALAGPTLLVAGKLVSTVGTLSAAFAGVAGAGAVAGAGIGAAGTAAGVASTGFLAALAPLAPWALGIGAVVAGAIALKNALSEEATPEIDLFANKVEQTQQNVQAYGRGVGRAMDTMVIEISDATEQAVGAYITLDDEATKSLTDLYVSSTTITEDIKNTTIQHYTDMTNMIIKGLDDRYTEEYNMMQEFFTQTSALNEQDELSALQSMTKYNEDRKAKEKEYNDQIQEILQIALDEKRALTLEESQTIAEIQQQMKEDAISTLSETEVESKIILERIKDYGTRITAEQAGEMIKNAEKQRKETVSKAELQYEETVAAIIRMRDEVGSITAEQAEKLIADATKQKDDSIAKADEMKFGVIQKIQDMNKDVLDSVNETSGEMLTVWEKLKQWWSDWEPGMKYFRYTIQGNTSGGGMGGGGGGSFAKGLSYVPFDGFQATLHEGEEILTKREAKEKRDGKQQSNGDTFIFNSPKPITAAQARREMIKAKKELALDY